MSLRIVCVACGGQSTEHEVSLLSANNVIDALPQDQYRPLITGIDKEGLWWLYPDGKFCRNADDPNKICLAANGIPVFPVRYPEGPALQELHSGKRHPFDLLFPVLHGSNGEDGAMQGLCQMLDCPCVGCDVSSSAACMDKDTSKQILAANGIRVARARLLRKGAELLHSGEIIAELGLPLFVKPACTGSSVGVAKIKSENELAAAVVDAFRYDRKVLVEEYIQGREIECAVLGNSEPFCAVPGEIIPHTEFYSYEAKYLLADGASLKAPAELSADQVAEVQALACRAYRALGCSGMARVDFFLKADGSWVLNELNTIPGFTKISMYPKLMQLSGFPYPELIARLLQLSMDAHAENKMLSNALP
jgi:D-alanine-D-alanine ligase